MTELESEVTAHRSPTCLLPKEIRVAAVMAHVTVKHIIGHKWETGPVEEEDSL